MKEFININDKRGILVGKYENDYEIISRKRVISDNMILYDIADLKGKFDFKLQLKQIEYIELSDYTNQIYCLLQYQHLLAGYTGNKWEGFGVEKVKVQKEKFAKVIDFWCRRDKEHFILFVV